MNFSSFIDYYQKQPLDFWNTHTLNADSKGRIYVIEGQIDPLKIRRIFQNSLIENQDFSKRDPVFRENLISIANSLEKTFGEDLSFVFQSCILANVKVSDKDGDETKISLSLDQVRYSEFFQKNFYLYFPQESEKIIDLSDFQMDKILLYFSCSANRNAFPRIENIKDLISVIEVSGFLIDSDLEEKLTSILLKKLESCRSNEFFRACKLILSSPNLYLKDNIQQILADSINHRLKQKGGQFFGKLATFLGNEASSNLTVLNLRGISIPPYSLLIHLSQYFPCIEQLTLQDPNAISFYIPVAWQTTLRVLDVSGSTSLLSVLQVDKIKNLETFTKTDTRI